MSSGRRPSVFLHVGAPKTGTTYLQDVLWRNRHTLARSGVLYPGLSKDAHFHAAVDVSGTHFQQHSDPLVAGAWRRLLEQYRDWPRTAVLSHELFSLLEPSGIQRVLDELSWADVHVVLTARDLARQIPAVWQEDIKNRQVLRFTEFTDALREPGEPTHHLAELFWRLQDFSRVLSAWAKELPPGRVHLITVPPSGAAPDELWNRFRRVVGIVDVLELDLRAERNASVGVAETNLLRRLNIALGDRVDWPSYDVLVKDYLALDVLGRRTHPIPLVLPESERDWVVSRSRALVAALRAGPYEIIGDLDELLPAPADATARHPDDVADAELLDTAVESLAGLVGRVSDTAPPQRPSWRTAAVRLANRNPVVGHLHQRYLTTKARLYRPR